MREILFKAKATDNGEWVEGSLINAFEYTCILQAEDKLHPTDYPYLDGNIGTFDGKATPIIPETVGQFTGLTDKNGEKIFEGDIVKKHSYIDYDNYANSEEYIGVVAFSDCAWTIETKKISHPIIIAISYTDDVKHFEVIGNTHDNPELMKGE